MKFYPSQLSNSTFFLEFSTCVAHPTGLKRVFPLRNRDLMYELQGLIEVPVLSDFQCLP